MMDHVGQGERVSVGVERRCLGSLLVIRLPVKRAAAESARLCRNFILLAAAAVSSYCLMVAYPSPKG